MTVPALATSFDSLFPAYSMDPVSCSLAGWAFILSSAPIVAVYRRRAGDRLDLARRDAHAADTLARHLMDASLDGILLTKPDGGILSANPAACEIFGHTEDRLIQGGRSLVLDEMDPEVQACLKERAQTGEFRGELWVRRGDERRIRAQVSSRIFSYRGERRTAMVVRDVTSQNETADHARIADAIAQSEEVFVAVTDGNWRLLWGNAGAERISGFRVDSIVGRTAPLYQHMERVDPRGLNELEQTLARDGIWTGHLESVREDGSAYSLYGHIRRIAGPQPGQYRHVAVLSDQARPAGAALRLESVDLRDPITGLPTRPHFEQRLQEYLHAADALGSAIAVFLIELDHLADVNETLGHRVGDRTLHQAAQRLQALCGSSGTVVRNSGAGFFVATAASVGPADGTTTEQMAQSLLESFRSPLDVLGRKIALTVSIGVARFPEEGRESGDLMRAAETALQAAKERGGDLIQYFGHMAAESRAMVVSTAAALREDLQSSRLSTHFQPIVQADSRRVVAMEALARWHRADRGWVPPSEFVPAAERAGLMGELSAAVVDNVSAHLEQCHRAGMSRLLCSVNLSARQLREGAAAEQIVAKLRSRCVDPGLISIEITETMLMEQAETVQPLLERLRHEGMRIVLDDFGTGYASLTYLKEFDVDGLKIDRTFVANLPEDPKETAILGAIMSVARELGLFVVAEGVEREDQAQFLQAAGVHYLQGYLFSPAIPSDQFIARYA